MKKISMIVIASAVLALSGCAPMTIAKMEQGERQVGEHLKVTLDSAWNQISFGGSKKPNIQNWTKEGFLIDSLTIYTGIKNGETMHDEFNAKEAVFKFRSEMQADQVVALFEGMLTRDGSVFKLNKLEPTLFGGVKGFRFDFNLIRKSDNVELNGMAIGGVNQGELYAMVYQAPKLGFFPREQARVAQIMSSAVIK